MKPYRTLNLTLDNVMFIRNLNSSIIAAVEDVDLLSEFVEIDGLVLVVKFIAIKTRGSKTHDVIIIPPHSSEKAIELYDKLLSSSPTDETGNIDMEYEPNDILVIDSLLSKLTSSVQLDNQHVTCTLRPTPTNSHYPQCICPTSDVRIEHTSPKKIAHISYCLRD